MRCIAGEAIKIICKKCGENGTSVGIDVVDFLRNIPLHECCNASGRCNPSRKTGMLLTAEILIFDLVTRGAKREMGGGGGEEKFEIYQDRDYRTVTRNREREKDKDSY